MIIEWFMRGFATHADAVQATNQLIESAPLDDSETYSVDCYILKTGEMRYGVTIIPAREEAIARAEYEEDR